jgi:hypothetical protein
VSQLFKPKPADFEVLYDAGYQNVCVEVEHTTHSMWVRRASKRIRWAALRAAETRCAA